MGGGNVGIAPGNRQLTTDHGLKGFPDHNVIYLLNLQVHVLLGQLLE